MFKRLFWLVLGVAVGFGGSFWVMQRLRKAARRYAPDRLAGEAATAARGVVAELRAAAAEGRAGMREREAELRAELGRARPS